MEFLRQWMLKNPSNCVNVINSSRHNQVLWPEELDTILNGEVKLTTIDLYGNDLLNLGHFLDNYKYISIIYTHHRIDYFLSHKQYDDIMKLDKVYNQLLVELRKKKLERVLKDDYKI